MLRKADRMGSTTSQMEIVTPRVNLNVAVTVASLDPPSPAPRNGRQRMGYVVVLEDLTDLLRAQKQTAWREVARRIAHEIKNPLTPLALSAERIRRHLERGDSARCRFAERHSPVRHHHQLARWRRCARWWTSSPRWPASRLPSRNRPTSTHRQRGAG